MENRHIIPNDKALEFMMAGKAIATLQSQVTGDHITYKIRKPKEEADADEPRARYVSVLNGPSNVNSYMYIGAMKKTANGWVFITGRGVSQGAKSVKVFRYVMSRLLHDIEPEGVTIWHEGRCCRCGRKLTQPESIQAGIGPECATMMVIIKKLMA